MHVAVQRTGGKRSDNTNSDLRGNFKNTWTKSLFLPAFTLPFEGIQHEAQTLSKPTK